MFLWTEADCSEQAERRGAVDAAIIADDNDRLMTGEWPTSGACFSLKELEERRHSELEERSKRTVSQLMLESWQLVWEMVPSPPHTYLSPRVHVPICICMRFATECREIRRKWVSVVSELGLRKTRRVSARNIRANLKT